jgi:replication factor C subunit 2/4
MNNSKEHNVIVKNNIMINNKKPMVCLNESNLPFSDKYRPRKVEDLIINDIITKKINNIIETRDIPNIIFTGKSGVGKTSTIHCIARKIYPREYHDSIIELNASDDRGIKSVHETIINFCKRKVEYKDGYAQHKLLILDEADNITPKAQRLINSIMEKYPKTRFAFTCNNSSDIIESIQSRCIIIRFTKSPPEEFIKRIEKICKNEKIEYDLNALMYLFEICQKDLRQTLNMLELTYQTYSKITINNINKICDIPSQSILYELLQSILEKNIKNVCTLILRFQTEGYYSLDVLLHFIQYVKNDEKIDEELKINLINILSNYSYIMSKSGTNYIQLTSALLTCI